MLSSANKASSIADSQRTSLMTRGDNEELKNARLLTQSDFGKDTNEYLEGNSGKKEEPETRNQEMKNFPEKGMAQTGFPERNSVKMKSNKKGDQEKSKNEKAHGKGEAIATELQGKGFNLNGKSLNIVKT